MVWMDGWMGDGMGWDVIRGREIQRLKTFERISIHSFAKMNPRDKSEMDKRNRYLKEDELEGESLPALPSLRRPLPGK